MNQLDALIWSSRRTARNMLDGAWRKSRLKVSFVAVSALGLWLLAFVGTRFGLQLLEEFGAELLGSSGGVALADLLLGRLLSLFALALFAMLIFSNIAVAFATFYRARELVLLMRSPIPIGTLFTARFLECVTFSSWASVFLGSPVLLAYGLERAAPLGFYPALIVAGVPFIVLPAALGTFAAVILARFFGHIRRPVWIGFFVLAGGFLFLMARRALLASPTLDAAVGDTAPLAALAGTLSRSQSPYLPSTWFADAVFGAASGDLPTALFALGLLTANALFAVLLAQLVAERWWVRGYTSLGDRDVQKKAATARGPLALIDRALGLLPQPTRALMSKDIKLFWRDPTQWSQFVLFFGLLALYVANLDQRGPGSGGWIALLNLGACLLILATLTTRFIYPLLSLEGRRFWILHLTPLSRRRLVLQKLTLSVVTTAAFTLILAALTGWKLALQPLPLLASLLTVLLASLALSALAVGLGSLFPDFSSDNPARITSGLGGTLTFILSVFYILLVVAALIPILHAPLLARFIDSTAAGGIAIGSVVFIAVLTGVTSWVPLRMGVRHLEKLEM
ncbi:MAG: hypothetical protein AAGD38_21375 [Acidobacteriota bacterium]